jgi:hypothetical protein
VVLFNASEADHIRGVGRILIGFWLMLLGLTIIREMSSCRHVGSIVGPHLRAHRVAVAIDEHGKDHLAKVGTLILAEAVSTKRLPARSLKVQAGGVHEHQIKPREQIAPIRKQVFFDNVLGTARRKRRATLLVLVGEFLAQPRHRPVEVMQNRQ